MSAAFLIQSAISLVAVALLVALARWARIARPCPPLDAASAARLLREEFPDAPLDQVWIAADGQGAIARAGERALVLFRAGDAYVARAAPWAEARRPLDADGRLLVRFGDIGAPSTRLRLPQSPAWPPAEGASA